MTNPATPPSPPEYPIDSDLDETLQVFWKKNGPAVMILCALVALAFLGKDGWDYYSRQREQGIEQEFAGAQTQDRFQAFAEAHPDHPLAGVAETRLGDFAYASNRMDAAITAYGRAIDILKTGPLAARARLGLAMAKIQAGEKSDGEAALHQLADDTAQFKAIRSEATYQLASLAAAAGKAAEVQQLLAQLMQIDPSSPWTQRAYSLQAQASAGESSRPGPGPGISFRPSGK